MLACIDLVGQAHLGLDSFPKIPPSALAKVHSGRLESIGESGRSRAASPELRVAQTQARDAAAAHKARLMSESRPYGVLQGDFVRSGSILSKKSLLRLMMWWSD